MLYTFFDFAKRILDSKNKFFNKDIIIERIIFNPEEINIKLQPCNYAFEEKDIFIHCNDMNNPGIDTQSLVNIANRNFQTGKISKLTESCPLPLIQSKALNYRG
jgi:hypothetical protein